MDNENKEQEQQKLKEFNAEKYFDDLLRRMEREDLNKSVKEKLG